MKNNTTKSTKLKNVHKIDSASFKGYRMAVMRRGVNFFAHFSTSRTGSWESARKAATECRNRLLAKLSSLHSTEDLLAYLDEWNAKRKQNLV